MPIFGLQLPDSIATDKDFADFLQRLCETGTALGSSLPAAHAVDASFYRRFVREDTLRQMLPSTG